MNIVQYLSKLVGIVDGVGFVERRAKPQPALGSQQGAVAHELARDIEAAIKLAIVQDRSQIGMIEGVAGTETVIVLRTVKEELGVIV